MHINSIKKSLRPKDDGHTAWYRFKSWSSQPLPAVSGASTLQWRIIFLAEFQGGTHKKQGVCLFLLRNPFSTILRTQIYDPSKLSHHLRVLPPNAIHVNLETKFPTHEILETNLTHNTPTYLLVDLFIMCLPLFYKLQELESFCPIYHYCHHHLAKVSLEDSQYIVTEWAKN